jgi:hypothetical protein
LHSPLCSLPPTNLGRIEEGRKERRSEGESRARGTGKQHQEEESRETAVIRVRESRCLSKVVSDFLFLCLTAATTITNYTEAQRRRACMDVAFPSHNKQLKHIARTSESFHPHPSLFLPKDDIHPKSYVAILCERKYGA